MSFPKPSESESCDSYAGNEFDEEDYERVKLPLDAHINAMNSNEFDEEDYERVKLPLDAHINAMNSMRIFVIRALIDVLLKELDIEQIAKETIKNALITPLTEMNVVPSTTDTTLFSGVFNQVREYMENCLKQALGDKSQEQCCQIRSLELAQTSDLTLKFKAKNSQDNFCSKYKMDFTEICLLGEGGFGNVFKVQKNSNKISYAIKKIPFQHGKSDVKICQREVQQLEVLSHKNVVRYYDSWTEMDGINQHAEESQVGSTPESFEDELSCETAKLFKGFEGFNDGLAGIKLFIQMELCGDTLSRWLIRRREVKCSENNPGDNKKMVRQILKGVQYLHEKGIIHRDLKPDNILINHFGKSNFEAKITDFGLSRKFFKSSDCNIEEDQRCSERDTDNKVLTCCIGTLQYASPEQKNGSCYDFKSDIYSVGFMAFEIFWSMGSDTEKSKNFEILKSSKVIDEFVKKDKNESDFVRLMTKSNPVERPSAEEALMNKCLAKSTNLEETLREQMANLNLRLKRMKAVCTCGASGS